MRLWNATLMGSLVILLAACQTMPGDNVAVEGKAAEYRFPDKAYRPDTRQDAQLYRVDGTASEIRVLVYRGGSLAGAGHNHVVVPGVLRGALWLPEDGLGGVSLDIAVPLDKLQVDPASAREAVGGSFGGTVDEASRQGTRENMLGDDGLKAAEFPVLGLRVRQAAGELPRPVLQLQVYLHGRRHDVTVPVAVSRDKDGLRAQGRFAVRQSWFGLEPFSTLGGALRVQDWLTIEFDVLARPASQP